MPFIDSSAQHFGALAVLVCVLTACAGQQQRADDALRARQTLVGMPADRLLSCAGVPERRAEANGRQFFTYTQQSAAVSSGPSTSLGVFGGSGGSGVGIGLGIPLGTGGGGTYASQSCEATFTIEGGVVRQLLYSGEPGQCYPIVANCLGPGL